MPLKNLLLAVFLLVFEAGAEQCCPMKTVGNISYSLVSKPFDGELPSQCANGCVYTITNTSNPRFCFQKGKNILLLCITTACSFPVPIHFHYQKENYHPISSFLRWNTTLELLFMCFSFLSLKLEAFFNALVQALDKLFFRWPACQV